MLNRKYITLLEATLCSIYAEQSRFRCFICSPLSILYIKRIKAYSHTCGGSWRLYGEGGPVLYRLSTTCHHISELTVQGEPQTGDLRNWSFALNPEQQMLTRRNIKGKVWWIHLRTTLQLEKTELSTDGDVFAVCRMEILVGGTRNPAGDLRLQDRVSLEDNQ